MSPDDCNNSARMELSSTNIKIQMSDKQVVDEPIFKREIHQANFNTIGGETSVHTQLKNLTHYQQDLTMEEAAQDDTQAQTTEQLNGMQTSTMQSEAQTIRRDTVLSPHEDPWNPGMSKQHKLAQRSSIMSPRLIPTAHIDLPVPGTTSSYAGMVQQKAKKKNKKSVSKNSKSSST